MEAKAKPGRRKNSCRFDPYYKVEMWSPIWAAWKPIQKVYGSEQEAIDSVRSGRARVMRMTESGREFGEPFEVPSQ